MTNPDPWTPAANARIEWAKVLDDIAYLLGDAHTDNPLVRDAVSERKLADVLSIPRSTLVGWLAGSEPRHSDGEMLIAHWCRLTGKARTFIHVDRVVFSASKANAPSTSRPLQRREDHGSARELKAALQTSRFIESAR